MKIVLVHPSNAHIYNKIKKSNIKLDKKTAKSPPIGLLYIAAVLHQNKFDVSVVDAEALNLDLNQTKDKILKSNPDLVCITCTTPLFPVAVDLCKVIKDIDNKIKTLLGGPHVSALPKNVLENPYVDFIIFGEGEIALLELVKALKLNKKLDTILGLGFKKNRNLIINAKRPLIKDLDTLPFPARDLVNPKWYMHSMSGEKMTMIFTSRGCPYQCIFCDSCITFGNKTRFRSVNNVVNEIEEIINKYGIKYIIFSDDTFTLNKQRTIDICKKIVEKKLNIRFYCFSRVDRIDKEMLEWLKKAGCDTISFGIESGDDKILKIMKKGITVQQARKAIALVKEVGIKIRASYMIGNFGDTRETIKKTIDFAKELDTDFAQFSIATPFPGTEMWDMAKSKGIKLEEDFSQYSWYYSPIFLVSDIPSEELKQIQRQAYDSYRNGKQGDLC